MRRIIATTLISLDGVVEAPGGGDYEHAGWTFKDVEFAPEAYAIKGEEQEEAGALLVGRNTFKEFEAAWPGREDFVRYNSLPKYVVSTTLTEAEVEASPWQHCHLLTGTDDVAKLREQEGDPIIIHGSPTLVRSLLAAELLDQLTILEFPVILGAGMRLFGDGGPKQRAKLTRSETFSNGMRLAVFDILHG